MKPEIQGFFLLMLSLIFTAVAQSLATQYDDPELNITIALITIVAFPFVEGNEERRKEKF